MAEKYIIIQLEAQMPPGGGPVTITGGGLTKTKMSSLASTRRQTNLPGVGVGVGFPKLVPVRQQARTL